MITFLDTTTSIVVPSKQSDVLYDGSITKRKHYLKTYSLDKSPVLLCLSVEYWMSVLGKVWY